MKKVYYIMVAGAGQVANLMHEKECQADRRSHGVIKFMCIYETVNINKLICTSTYAMEEANGFYLI